MLPDDREAGYLWDMLDSARAVQEFVMDVKHEYGEIKQERMWLVATVHVPALIPQLKTIFFPNRPSPTPLKIMWHPL